MSGVTFLLGLILWILMIWTLTYAAARKLASPKKGTKWWIW